MRQTMRRTKWLFIVPLALIALVIGGSWVYVNVIEGDPPDHLALETSAKESPQTTASENTATGGSIDGTWAPSTGSQLGYRVKEVLFGQSTTAVGRTSDVTGKLEIAGTSVT